MFSFISPSSGTISLVITGTIITIAVTRWLYITKDKVVNVFIAASHSICQEIIFFSVLNGSDSSSQHLYLGSLIFADFTHHFLPGENLVFWNKIKDDYIDLESGRDLLDGGSVILDVLGALAE